IQMRLLILLAAVGAVSALTRNKRKANWAALPADVKDDNLELLFVHSMWRHGDRAAEHEVPGPGVDQFPEDAWTFGGGGYGELSPEGMKMHFELGRKLRKRYITETFPKFLSEAYNSKEIYIRSTDYNRTLISAYSNVQGMYSGSGVEGQNYPSKDDLPEWPENFVPIPVHTVDYGIDYPGHPDFQCDRQDQLQEMVRNSPEYQAYTKDPNVAPMLQYLTEETGADVTVENIYELNDPLFCENIHMDDLNQTGANIKDFYPWYFTGSVVDMVGDIIERHEEFEDGMGNPGGINGVDVSIEIPKIRAGETLKMFVGNVDGVMKCLDAPDDDSCRPFFKTRKYYALSAHDTTLSAFLTILGVKKKVVPNGYPQYSAAILLEVYRDKRTNERVFKFLYHADKNSDFTPITSTVHGCDVTNDTCSISVLYDLVAKYASDIDMATLCATPVNGAPPSTSGKPAAVTSTTPTSTSTTTKTTTTTTTQTPTTTSAVSAPSLIAAFAVMILSVLH
ncbi:hypothetical protein PMAYCL1PPCAC_09154, partial [Pristionchus mayeri]